MHVRIPYLAICQNTTVTVFKVVKFIVKKNHKKLSRPLNIYHLNVIFIGNIDIFPLISLA
jgi:hypothetical protein